jgi:RNA polymerase sigma factor FliA
LKPLVTTMRSGSSLAAEERERLLLRYLPEVRYIARRIYDRLPSYISFGDLVQAGTLGLIDAVDRFDHERNVDLATYAKFRIRGSIMDSLRQADWSPRGLRMSVRRVEHVSRDLATELGRWPTESEVAAKLELTLEQYQELLGSLTGLTLESLDTQLEDSDETMVDRLQAPEDESPLRLYLRTELRELVVKGLGELGEKERQVLSLYYLEELTMKEVGAVLNVGESRVSQIHTSALIRLRSAIKDLALSKVTNPADVTPRRGGVQ